METIIKTIGRRRGCHQAYRCGLNESMLMTMPHEPQQVIDAGIVWCLHCDHDASYHDRDWLSVTSTALAEQNLFAETLCTKPNGLIQANS